LSNQPPSDFSERFCFGRSADSLKWYVIEEMRKYKWIASKNAGYDLGRRAIDEWEHKYGWRYCRWRRFEHIEGAFCWFEFDGVDFAILKNVQVFTDLLKKIVARMKEEEIIRLNDGREVRKIYDNFETLEWAQSRPELAKYVEHVRLFLELININTARLEIPTSWKELALAA
jgi:hypothetical protein